MADANVSVSFTASTNDFVSQVSEAKDALRTFSAPFGEINQQLISFGNAASQAFSTDRLSPYRDALSTTQSLQQSFALDSAKAAAALRQGDEEAYADAARAAQLAASEELRLLADATKQKLALYSEEARAYEISQQQKLVLSQQALNEEYAAELAILQKEDALGGQSLAAKQRADDMVIEATRRRDEQMAGLSRSALQQEERDYQALGNSIMQAFNSQLRGLLTGTTSWRNAFRSVLLDLTTRFIEFCETSVGRYALAEAMKTAATTSGVAARTAAEQGGAAASLGAQGAAMVKSILSSAAETFAGVFGFLAPLMGPLAVGPAAAAQATVAGMAGTVASADIGMWRAPRDMLTLVHHNELIMPSAEAGAFRSLLTSSASGSSPAASVAIHPTTHFNVSAIDGPSVASWMRSNSGQMAKALDEAVRHGAALGLKRLGG